MRLNVTSKKKLTKTDKSKKAAKEKKSKGPKLLPNYTDMSPCKYDSISIPITKMTYGTINSCDLWSIGTKEGGIKIEFGWLHLLLIMLDTVIVNHPDDFSKLLETNEVTNSNFVVDKVYGKYSYENNYKAYKIFNSGYYLETTLTADVIFNAIVGLMKSLDMGLEDIEFNMINYEYKNINTRYDKVTQEEVIITIDKLKEALKQNMHMEYVSILGTITSAHRLDVALVAFCNILYDKYGMLEIMKLPRYESTGICIADPDDVNPNIVQIRGSMVAVYTDSDDKGIITFMKESMKLLNIKSEDVTFKMKALKLIENKEDWTN